MDGLGCSFIGGIRCMFNNQLSIAMARKRARLVAKGFSQVFGLDYKETFSPVIQFETVRIILAIAALENLVIQVLDIKTAFLHGKLDEEIYMMRPEGFVIKGQESKVYKIEQALYGLKQASLAWNKEAHKNLVLVAKSLIQVFIKTNPKESLSYYMLTM